MTKLYVQEDITDWRDGVKEQGIEVINKEDILDLIDEGVSTSAIAQATVVGREEKKTPEDIIRGNKLLLLTGAMQDISGIVKDQWRKVVAPSGRAFNSNRYIGKALNEEDEASYVDAQTVTGVSNAINYLENVIPGHIWNRLMNLIDAGEDIVPHAEKLKDRIDHYVKILLEANGE